MRAAVVVAIALAGGVGAALRFVVDGLVQRHNATGLPLGTFSINVSGSFALGLVTGWTMTNGAWAQLPAIVGTGLLGGYTTFSAASVEVVRLALEKRPGWALAYAAGTIVAACGAAAAGFVIVGN